MKKICKNCGSVNVKEGEFCSKRCDFIFNERMDLWHRNSSRKEKKISDFSGINLYKVRGPIKSYKFDYFFDRATSFLTRKRRIKPIRNPRKILFLRNDHIGDMVYATPAFKAVKEAFPNTKVVVIAEPHNKSIIEKDKNVDEIWEIDLFWRRLFRFQLGAFHDYLKILRKVRKEKFDVGVDLRRSKLNMFFFLFVPRIKNRVSNFNINGGKFFLTHPLLYKKENLNHEENIDMINGAFGLNTPYYQPYIATDKEDEGKVEKFLKENKIKEYIVVMPGSTEFDKQWPIKRVNEFVVRFLQKYKEHKIVVSGGKGEKETIQKLCENDKERCIPEIGVFDFRSLAVFLKKADAIIANNGAGTDIGWTVDGNLVALAGGTVILDMHMPLKRTKLVISKMPYFPYPPAITNIKVEEVMKAVDEFIKERNKK